MQNNMGQEEIEKIENCIFDLAKRHKDVMGYFNKEYVAKEVFGKVLKIKLLFFLDSEYNYRCNM